MQGELDSLSLLVCFGLSAALSANRNTNWYLVTGEEEEGVQSLEIAPFELRSFQGERLTRI